MSKAAAWKQSHRNDDRGAVAPERRSYSSPGSSQCANVTSMPCACRTAANWR